MSKKHRPERCPFCGNNAEIVYSHSSHGEKLYHFGCQHEFCIAHHIVSSVSEDEIGEYVKDWNMRTPDK